MKAYLLDTNVILLALANPGRLSPNVRKAAARGPNVLSAASYWEVVLKCEKGNLDVGDPGTWWLDALGQLAAVPLPIRPEHISALRGLPPLHKDPFDRILISQAIAENLHLATADDEIRRYASPRLHVLP